MKKFFQKAVALGLAAGMILSVSACDNGGNGGDNNVSVWTADSTLRFNRDKEYGGEKSTAFRISMAKNEYESAQVILTPEKDVSSYSVTLNDLTSAGGATLSKENFSVYHQKYLNVTKQSDGFSTGFGWYPDALLPLETAAKYGENTVKAGENQGLWITCYCPKDQAAGTYSGKFVVHCDGKDYEISANVTVYDYELTDEINAKSSFVINRAFMNASGDDSLEHYKAAYDLLLEYRLAGLNLPTLVEDTGYYLASVKEYYDKTPSYSIPYTIAYNSTANDLDMDYDKFKDTVFALAEMSLQDGKNYLDKAYLYLGSLIDEPTMAGVVDRAVRISHQVEVAKEEIAAEMEGDSAYGGAMGAELIETVRNLPHIVTNRYTDELYNDGEGVKYWVPLFDDFDTVVNQQMYENSGTEFWWYGCIGPNNPFPTYQLDDYLITSRVVSWMQKDYGASGNLFWDTCFWVEYRDGVYERKDPYEASPEHFPGDNGDGFLFYPGTKYGIGPVASIRLHSIRDGLEEYEILNELEQKYAEKGYDSDEILQTLYKRLYNNAQVNSDVMNDTSLFSAVREELIALGEMAQTYGGYIKEVDEKSTEVTFTVAAEEGVAVKLNGKAATAVSENGTLKEYVCTVKLDQEENAFTMELEKDGKSMTYTHALGGRSVVFNAVETEDDLALFSVPDGADDALGLVDGMAYFGTEGKALKVDLPASVNKTAQLKFTTDFAALKTADKLAVEIFNPTKDSIPLVMYVDAPSSDYLMQIYSGTLLPGKTVVEGALSAQYGDIRSIVFWIGSKGDAARTVYFDNFMLKG
ncbi:MAG: hypothetical protein DBX59_07425 [Bacillota bacterium]|nr:MAG: hypothetical protein DBX59_07425 [Bacillota bacterium]